VKRLSPVKLKLLQLIRDDGGSYCPSIELDPIIIRSLKELVSERRLTVEPNDGAPPRYTMTAQGYDDAPA
jgi:hypothetical protein